MTKKYIQQFSLQKAYGTIRIENLWKEMQSTNDLVHERLTASNPSCHK